MSARDIAMTVIAVLLLAIAFAVRVPLADFDFGDGRVRCGVDGFTPSCGSIAPR